MNLKEILKGHLTKEEMELCPRSYETIGDIAILEIPPELSHKENLIGIKLMQNRKNIRLVLKKLGGREGEFRTKRYAKIAGSGSTETVHKENYCEFYLDISKVYFSSKESTERERIASMVKPREKILVMGAGIGPLPIVIARKKTVEILGIDANPDAIFYFNQNIRRNKTRGKVVAELSDAMEFHKTQQKFSRVVMAIPHDPERFIEPAIRCLKAKGMLHYYTISKESDLDQTKLDLESRLNDVKIKHRIINLRKVLPYSPRVYKVCFDLRIY